MQRCRISLLALFAVAALTVTVLNVAPVCADEVQLAGIRLGQHALNVLQVYGEPQAVIHGAEGPGSITNYSAGGGAAAGAGAGAGAGGGGEMGPGAGPGAGMPGMGGGPGGGPGGPEGFGAGLAGIMGALTGGAALPGMGGGPGGGESRAGGPGAPGGGAGPGAQGAGGAGAGRGGPQATRFAQARQLPDWASPAQVEMRAKETMWLYRRGDVALSFILDRDGYVVSIAAGGKKCNWVRTALGEPLRTVKLGDSFQTVIDRYGYPADTTVEPGDGFSQDTTLHYGEMQNITFTLRDMKVRRIHIWEVDLRPEAPVRAPAAGLAGLPKPGIPRAGIPAAPGAPSGFRR